MFWNKKKSFLSSIKIAGKPLSVWINAFLPPLLWAGVIFFFSSRSELPSASYSSLDFIFKKMAHITVFSVLFIFMDRGFRVYSRNYSLRKHWYLPVFICFAYAMSDEMHRYFVPNRHQTFRDVGYDMLGVFTMYLYKTDRI